MKANEGKAASPELAPYNRPKIRATKEDAAAIAIDFELIWGRLPDELQQETEQEYLNVSEFLERCFKRLPTAAALDADKSRRRKDGRP